MTRFSHNPIIPGRGVCDPHIHVFRDKAWLYASHDRSPDNTSWFMDDWQIWSSDNLVDWTLESTLRPEDTYLGPCDRCWAVDVAERNGRYYLYFSKGHDEVGVAVSDHPGRGFRDALGRPLLPKGLTDTHQYDPTAFIDDDEARTPYLLWGCTYHGSGYKIARLNDDMISLAEPPRTLVIHGDHPRDDKSFLHKHGGLYYLSWASHYATSEQVGGPYTYRGNFGAAQEHGSFFNFKGQNFFACGQFDTSLFYRSSALTCVHYRANGEIVSDPLIQTFGMGHYDARWPRIMAAWFTAGHRVRKVENSVAGFDVEVLDAQSWLHFPRVHHLEANARISLYCICHSGTDVVVEIRAGSPHGPVLGSCPLKPTRTWQSHAYRMPTIQLTNTAGTHDLYFTFRGAGPELLRLGWIRIHPTT